MAVRIRFAIEISIGLIATSTSFAQTPLTDKTAVIHPRDIAAALYREPMTQSDISLEWYTYMSLAALVHAEDSKPGLGVALAAEDHGLGIPEATGLVQVLRDVGERTERLALRVSICRAAISSGQDYVGWWARYEDEVRSHRRATIDALVREIDSSIWEASLEPKYLPWLRGDGLGDRINFQKQVDVADYTIWMRGWCGG
jgi:hypothetical protein